MQNDLKSNITYLILAGGRGQRMNGVDKGLMQWQNKPMIEHILSQLNATFDNTIISANRNVQIYAQYAHSVVEDTVNGFQGPLCGILSAMQCCTTNYLLCVPCDSPEPPTNMLQQLRTCMITHQKTAAICHDGDRTQPLFALITCEHKKLLSAFIEEGHRKVHDFMQLIDPAICDFSAHKKHFNNFNHPDDMQP